MTPPLAAPGHWIADHRGDGRGVRVSSHVEAGFLVLSTWKAGTCVATVRLLPDEAAELVAGIAEGLGRLARGAVLDGDRLARLEQRLAVLEASDGRVDAPQD
jgi:hypothetical protein